MQLLHRPFLFVCCVPLLALPVALPVQARETTITGSAEMGYNTTERTYDSDEQAARQGDAGDDQEIYISPKITITSKGVRDTLEAFYVFSPNYNFVESTTEVDHRLHIRNDRFLSQKWTLTLSEDFIYTDDPDKEERFSGIKPAEQFDPFVPSEQPVSDPLSDDLPTRHRYWKNTVGFQTSYATGQHTMLSGGYGFEVLRNDQGGTGYDEYDKHYFSANMSHSLNASWRTSLGLSYILGLYDDSAKQDTYGSKDLKQYGGNLGIDYIRSVRDSFPLRYNYSETSYDDTRRKGTQTHGWSAGWDHAWSPRTRLAVGAGPSYSKTEGQEGDWGYNGYLTFVRKYQHASLSLQLEKKFEAENFTGTDESGVKDKKSARVQFSYQYSPRTSLELFSRYNKDSEIEPQGIYRIAAETLRPTAGKTGDSTYDKEEYEFGIGWRYEFIRDWAINTRYVYSIVDGDLQADQYTEHQVVFSLSTSKDFWHKDGR
ncbi:MAG: hypothetical protein ACOX5Z_06225 [Desulfobulbus sp.]|jgi:hypothetical protein